MLKSIALSIFTWLHGWGQPSIELEPLTLFPWHNSSVFHLPEMKPDLMTENMVQVYLQDLAIQNSHQTKIRTHQAKNPEWQKHQGIWIQSDWHHLASNQGTMPLPAASLTKIATTLSALDQWGSQHQFITNLYSLGEIKNGILQGDLIIEGSSDPLFVWEEVIALGNALDELGIKAVQGNLLITEQFYMNYQDDALQAGELFKQGINRDQWQSEVTQQYLQMPAGTAQPEIAIQGKIKAIRQLPTDAQLLITHQSLPLAEILRQMNIYSNNKMAQMLADSLGGADQLGKLVAQIAQFPPAEINLINGSGLGEANRISPRAVCQMLLAIEQLLKPNSLVIADLFPTAGRDLVGTLKSRGLPRGTTVKTGTLDRVSALAGVIPTKHHGNVYFSIINYGSQYEYFRQRQDWLLNELVQKWELAAEDLTLAQKEDWFLGDPQRNILNNEPYNME